MINGSMKRIEEALEATCRQIETRHFGPTETSKQGREALTEIKEIREAVPDGLGDTINYFNNPHSIKFDCISDWIEWDAQMRIEQHEAAKLLQRIITDDQI